jgi:hypothetical protein
MSPVPDDHFLTNRKQSLIRSKQTPDPSVQFLVNMQTTDKFNADEQLRISAQLFFASFHDQIIIKLSHLDKCVRLHLF